MIPSQLLAGSLVALLNLFAAGVLEARVINELQISQAVDQFTQPSLGAITATPQRDGAGRITGYVWSDGGANTVTQTWTRGPGGRIESAGADVPGAPAFDYLIDPQTPEESFDSFGRRLKCETAGGIWTYEYGSWVYDENTSSWVFDSSFGGQLASATHPTLGTFTYQFDSIGRRIDEGAENTTDLLNRTTAWTHDQSKTITINADPNARVWFNGTEVTGFSGSHQEAVTPPGPEGGWATYDVLAVLEGAGDGAGDPAPNPLASPDAKAEQSGAVWVPPLAETLTYDAAGNRQSSAQWDYGWNAKNQLARIRTKGYETAPQAYDLTFAYDSEGRRVQKHVVELQNGEVVAEKTVTYVWDGWDLLYERHQLPSGLTLLERAYLWGPDIADGKAGGAGGLLLIRETKGDTTTEIIPLYDGTGHVVALTDINKNLLASYAYGPFGEKIAASGPRAQNNPWRWATKYLDEETGLYYFGQRYFDPVTGQWLSREPLGESESVNLYVYAGNDPINHVDVLGLSAQKIDEISQQLGPFAFDNPDNLELLFELRRKLQDNDFRITQTRERLGLNNVGIFLGSDGAIVLGQDNTYLIDFASRNHPSSQNAWNEAGFGGRIWMSITEGIPQYWENTKRRHALDGAKSPLLGAIIEHTPGFGSSYIASSHVDKGQYGWATFNYLLAGVDAAPMAYGARSVSNLSLKGLVPNGFFRGSSTTRLSNLDDLMLWPEFNQVFSSYGKRKLRRELWSEFLEDQSGFLARKSVQDTLGDSGHIVTQTQLGVLDRLDLSSFRLFEATKTARGIQFGTEFTTSLFGEGLPPGPFFFDTKNAWKGAIWGSAAAWGTANALDGF